MLSRKIRRIIMHCNKLGELQDLVADLKTRIEKLESNLARYEQSDADFNLMSKRIQDEILRSQEVRTLFERFVLNQNDINHIVKTLAQKAGMM